MMQEMLNHIARWFHQRRARRRFPAKEPMKLGWVRMDKETRG